MKINLNKTIRSLSLALDLSQMNLESSSEVVEDISNINYTNHQFTNHAQRTTYIALEIANYLNLDEDTKQQLYISALFHDIGATSYFSECHISNTFIAGHCVNGSKIIKPFPIFNDLSNIILYHHENYNGTGPMKISGDSIPIESQIIRISDLVEILYDKSIPIFRQKSKIVSWIKNGENILFSSKLIDAFLQVSSTDTFWLNIENIAHIDFILDKLSPKLDIIIGLKELESIAYIFSRIIDTKSKFTATHSLGISKLAYNVSKFLGYPKDKCLKMKIAALLHDIGKLAIPLSILDKNASLTNDEFSIIKSHAYYTKLILDRMDIGSISEWAGNHHEKLNGGGYPTLLSSQEISEESRIICVCDIYQALTENRPYRLGLSAKEAFSIMHDMACKDFICKEALSHLKSVINSDKILDTI